MHSSSVWLISSDTEEGPNLIRGTGDEGFRSNAMRFTGE